jgi:chorismate mutase/prephenate dehydratase
MADTKEAFDKIRAALDDADRLLAKALDARARATKELQTLREQEPATFFKSATDAEIINAVGEHAGAFPRDAIRPVMREVLSACTNMIAPVEVVYAGQAGGFGHLAARKHFGSSAQLRPAASVEEVAAEVERKRASYGVLPFETSNDGAATATLNVLARTDVKITAEVLVQRAFHLLSASGEIERVERVYASAAAISATARFVAEHLPRATVIDARNGMVAAELAKQDPNAAVIGSHVVAEVAGLQYVRRAIEDEQGLATRYVTVGRDVPPRSGRDRTALVLSLHDRPGVLFDSLRPFADRAINLSRIETRPARDGTWRHLTLFELDGHVTDRNVLGAIEALRASNHQVKVLGSYPRRPESDGR